MSADFTALFQLVVVSHLLHLLAVAFAIDLAYITLEPFRYTRRVRDLYESVNKEVAAVEAQLNHKLKDSSLLTVRTEINSLRSLGLGPCFGFEKATGFKSFLRARRLFGTKAKSGWDIFIISFFLVILFSLLTLAVLKPDCFQLMINLGILTISSYFTATIVGLVGSSLPGIFIFCGFVIIRYKEKTIIKMLNSLREAHGITIDIDAYEKKIHDF